jgi:hypothetical protein
MLDGEDWRRRQLIERKARLKRLLGPRKRVLRYVEHWTTVGRRCSPMPAGSAWRGSSQSGVIWDIGRAGALRG